MFKNLGPNAIGIRNLPLPDAIELARETGFDGVEFSIREAADLAAAKGIDYVRDLFARAGVRPGHWGLPVRWASDERYEAELADLGRLAGVANALGCDRTTSVLWPWSDDRPYTENLAWSLKRLREIATILRDNGCRLGLEFIGPKTLRAGHKYEFIHTLDGLMELARIIGTGNVGVLLDAWHVYTSGGEMADLGTLSNQDVVVVHVNDAPAGIPRDEQMDLVRDLPMATGVIDLAGFMTGLRAMEYDGPVTVEPFNKPLADLAATDPKAAARKAKESLDRLWTA